MYLRILQSEIKDFVEGIGKFFRLTLSSDGLGSYYKTNFLLQQLHGYNLDTLENMLPWEREVLIAMLVQHIKEENDRIRDQQRKLYG